MSNQPNKKRSPKVRPTRGVDACLFAAAKTGALAQARSLVRRGANVEASNRKRETPLHCAARSGNLALVRYFIQMGADLAAQTFKGASVLRFATQSKNRKLVRWLLEEKGATFASADDLKGGLFGAIGKGDYRMARLLVEQGADVRSLGWQSQTTLHVAARSGALPAVVWHVEQEGLALDVADDQGKTPLDLAATAEIAEYLRLRFAGEPDSPL